MPTIRSGSARPSGSSAAPRYVTRIDAATNTIVIGREDELLANGLIADEVNLIRPERFTQENAGASDGALPRALRPDADAASRRRHAAFGFYKPQRAVSPGQLVALFDSRHDEVLGAATITLVILSGRTAEARPSPTDSTPVLVPERYAARGRARPKDRPVSS